MRHEIRFTTSTLNHPFCASGRSHAAQSLRLAEEFVFGRLHSVFIPFGEKDIASASPLPLSGGTDGAPVRPTQARPSVGIGCSDGRCPFVSLVALITWQDLLLRAKHLFVAAIGRRSPRRSAARRPRRARTAPAEGAGATDALIVPGVRAHRDERFIGAFARAGPSPPGRSPLKFAPPRSAELRAASLRFARSRFGSAREEVLMRTARSASLRFARIRFAAPRSAPVRFASRRSANRRFAPVRHPP